MTMLRRARRALLAGTFLATATACATNPVTGRRELSLVSEQQEIQMGQQGAQDVARSIGLVNDQALQDYVQRVGAGLAAKTQRPGLPWTFRVVDDPTPNAFALPGGFIFVTRGLLTLMENEAQLATVLGHEIGHVTARHSVQQMSRAQVAQLGLGIGAILSPTVAQLGDVAGTGLQLLFLRFSRDDERQADELGFGYALSDNYDVRQMATVFASLQRVEQLEHASPVPKWAATHPDPGERVQTAERRVASLNRSLDGTRVAEPEYLQRVDGLVYGDNPRQGFFRNNVFYQPDLKFQVTLPQGWQAQNTPEAVLAGSPQNDAALQLTLAQGASPEAAARAFLSQQGVQAGQAQQVTVNGVPAIASYFAAQTEQGTLRGLVAFFGYGGQTYQLLGFAPEARFGAYDATFRAVLGSFAPVTDPAILGVQPDRLRIVRLDQATTLQGFAQRYPSTVGVDLLAILNQVPGPQATLTAGTLAKRVTK